jgi:Protein of unknown function (DUF418)
MPPWLDWLDWLEWDSIGAGILGKILGLWFGFCVSLPRKLVALVVRNEQGRRRWSWLRRIGKMAVSTSLTLGVWTVVTWKPVWLAAGAEGDRVLTAVLIFVSATWPISLVWIWFSKPKYRSAAANLHMRASHYSRSSRAKAT